MSVAKLDENSSEDKEFKEEDLLLASGKFRDECVERFNKLAKAKYDKGQREHGGYLPIDVSISDLEDEVLDQWFYLQAVRAKIHAVCPEQEALFHKEREREKHEPR